MYSLGMAVYYSPGGSTKIEKGNRPAWAALFSSEGN